MSKKRQAAVKNGAWKPKTRKSMKRSRMKTSRRPTGELNLFLALWRENRHNWISRISGADLVPPLFDEDGELMNGRTFVSQFSHCLPKGTYPDLRLEPVNIIFKTVEEHRLWTEERRSLIDRPEWQWVFELEQKLKRELYEQ